MTKSKVISAIFVDSLRFSRWRGVSAADGNIYVSADNAGLYILRHQP